MSGSTATSCCARIGPASMALTVKATLTPVVATPSCHRHNQSLSNHTLQEDTQDKQDTCMGLSQPMYASSPLRGAIMYDSCCQQRCRKPASADNSQVLAARTCKSRRPSCLQSTRQLLVVITLALTPFHNLLATANAAGQCASSQVQIPLMSLLLVVVSPVAQH